jgi:hypothetical protein
MVFKGIIILQLILMGCTSTPCPKKYMGNSNIFRYCKLDYGGNFKLREELNEKR